MTGINAPQIHNSCKISALGSHFSVDDLQDLGLIEALHGLCGLVVVHQNDAALAQIDDVAAADHAAVFAILVPYCIH